MFYSVDIGLYKEGFHARNFDCMNIPFAAAAGFYQYENYFYYAYQRVIDDNWGEAILDKEYNFNIDWIKNTDVVYEKLGLGFEKIEVVSKQQTLSEIQKAILNRYPVLFITKYEFLYYHRYYMTQSKAGNNFHSLIVDEFNDATNIYRIRDSSFMVGMETVDYEAEILFPLRIKEELLWEIIEKNKTDMKDKKQYLYILKRKENYEPILFEEMLKQSIDTINNEKSLLEKILLDFDLFKEALCANEQFFKRVICGGMECIFIAIEKFILKELNVSFKEEFYDFKLKFMKQKEGIFNRLYITALQNKELSKEKQEVLYQKLLKNKDELLDFLKKYYILLLEEQKNLEYKILDLSSLFNNRAFAISFQNKECADLTGNGICFLWDNLFIDKINDHVIRLHQSQENKNDNISCDEEHIKLEARTYKQIILYACSEYGSYEELIKMYYEENYIAACDFKVSDFYEIPIYGEKIIWTGKALEKKIDDTYDNLEFSARIFKYVLDINNNMIDEIVLPKRRNIHVFKIVGVAFK